MADLSDRDAVAAVLAHAYSRGYADRRHKRDYNPDRAADLALLLAPLLAQARAEGARDALNAAADAAAGMHDPPAPDCQEWADWFRERAAQHEEQP